MTQGESSSIAVVVPCYNEERRLDPGALERFARAHPEICFVLVNDGSRDRTLSLLQALQQAEPERFIVVDLPRNRGKAEAVRAGMQRAFELGVTLCGYWDADLATPLQEVLRFAEVLRRTPSLLLVMGSRVQLLGRSIERRASRHYLGRVFATAASTLLGLRVYDTQCGAKLFRVGEETRVLFAEPFEVGWTFDVELIARLIRLQRQRGGRPAAELIYELPVEHWRDVGGSKVSALDFLLALGEVARIHHRYLRAGAPPLALPED